jgi:putative SOS response-associated peptidase YedK
MCGRFVSKQSTDELAEHFDAVDQTDGEYRPDFNVAPTASVPTILVRHDDKVGRQLQLLRWGLVPSWAKDPSIGNRMINARMETVATKPAFRKAFAQRRCLIPADGFYEWEVIEGEKKKQPWFIHANDNDVLAFAGLYERWFDAERREMRTCTVITTSAADDLGKIHDRAPMLVTPENWDTWLDPQLTDTDELEPLLTAAVPGHLAAHKVGTAVGNVRNNTPDLMTPVDGLA